MNYECIACNRVFTQFEQVQTKNLYFAGGDEKPWREVYGTAIRCPICKNQPAGPCSSYKTEKPVNIIPHCPHCKKIVDTINAKRTTTIYGELRVGVNKEPGVDWGDYYGCSYEHGSEDPFPGAPERWEYTCPHCQKTINDPGSCIKPYAI